MNVAKLLNFSIKWKLILSFAAIVAVFILTALFNLLQVKQINAQLGNQNETVGLKQLALELKETVQDLNVIGAGLEISRDPAYIEKYNVKRKPFEEMIKRIGETAVTDEEIKWRSQLLTASNEYINQFDVAASLVKSMDKDSKDLITNLQYLYTESQTLKDNIFTYVDRFYERYVKDADAATAATDELLESTVAVMILVSAGVLVATVVIAVVLIRSFLLPIRRLGGAVAELAAGNLTHRIHSTASDELGELSRGFDRMADQVRAMMKHTQSVASSLAEHAQSFQSFSQGTAAANANILQAIQEISTGADEQAHLSEHAAAVIADLEQEMNGITVYAADMASRSKEAELTTEQGSDAVRSLQEASVQTESVLKHVVQVMESLDASSKRIGAIVGAITQISSQTHILSLNARIEAEQAGVHGKGFAVIAEEVRGLSAQTKQSTGTIGEIVVELQKQIGELKLSLIDAERSFQTQRGKVQETHSSFGAIRSAMSTVMEQTGHVHEKIEAVKTKNDALVHAVRQVAAIAEETAAGVEEVNSASFEQNGSINHIAGRSEQIAALSAELFDEISKFKLTDAPGNGSGSL